MHCDGWYTSVVVAMAWRYVEVLGLPLVLQFNYIFAEDFACVDGLDYSSQQGYKLRNMGCLPIEEFC